MDSEAESGFEPPAALGSIRRLLLERPEVAAWPALRELVERPVRDDALPCWDWALLASRSVGGEDRQALPAAAAIFCVFYAVHLVDDLLDEDPSGAQHRYGIGPVANLASCFQGLASVALDSADPGSEPGVELGAGARAWAHRQLGEMAASTALGQHLDATGADDEDGYWRAVRAKTPPLFVGALGLGALCGGASLQRAQSLAALGEDLGLLVQVSDDLADAMARPAEVDWRLEGTNLPILVARAGDHPSRARFRELQPLAAEGEEGALEEAQQILLESGAISYSVFCMIERTQAARTALADLHLADAAPILHLVDHLCRPVVALLERVGVEAPRELVEACAPEADGV